MQDGHLVEEKGSETQWQILVTAQPFLIKNVEVLQLTAYVRLETNCIACCDKYTLQQGVFTQQGISPTRSY